MANYIDIKNGPIHAKIAPNNGGMLAQLSIDGIDVLMLDEVAIEATPMCAGGSPVLFPFPSKTKGDTYTLDGRDYHMPMHGLVKNGVFAVKRQTEDTVLLWCKGSDTEREVSYRFDYLLELEYKVAGKSLFATAYVTNHSDRPLPHYLGWHPYFKATDRAALKLEHSMTSHYNHIDGRDEPTIAGLDLSKPWDNVFHTPLNKEFTLCNKADGYQLRCVLDDAHNVLVVYTGAEGAVCLEPWCGLPNSINTGRFVRTVQPGETECYTVELELERL